MRKLLLVTFLVLACTANTFAQINIIPKPVKMKTSSGKGFTLDANTKIVCDKEAVASAKVLQSYLRGATGYALPVIDSGICSENAIMLKLQSGIAKEGYVINSSKLCVNVFASTEAGLFYGIQTLRQLLPVEIFNDRPTDRAMTIPCVSIKDSPSYPWRGMMLDVSRYFLDADYVKHYLDMMAMHKMNVLHLHVVDDCGWRVEISKYPKLTEVGGFRGTGANRSGGYYTKKQIKEIVDYATKLHIDIVPEIELPAHCLSALVAYPWLGCKGDQFTMPTKHSISHEILCAGKETTYKFLEDVMTEVAEMFPSKYIHIGGDEARYSRWQKCPDCKKKMAELGYKDFKELQGYMTRRIEEFLMPKGKRIIGWDEILGCGLAPNSTVMTWHRPKTAITAAKSGNNVVMALTSHAYFDAPESKLPGEPPAATWLAPITLQKAYEWEPAPTELNAQQKKFILGAHGCLWTDQFLHKPFMQDMAVLNENRSERYVDYLTLPRMSALAEVVWTPQNKRSFDDFLTRQETQYNRYDLAGFHYRVPLPVATKPEKVSNGFKVTMTSPVKKAKICYTTDGTYPTAYSTEYTQPIVVDDLQKFSAITVIDHDLVSLAFKFPEDKSKKFDKYGQQIGQWKSGKVSAGTYKPVKFDATGKINKTGTYELTFIYTHGTQRLDIQSVKVVVNDKVVAEDKHHGTTGGQHKDNTYRLKVDAFETGANYTIEANVMGDTGNDSNGVVLLKRVE